jgi:hypothetical protein
MKVAHSKIAKVRPAAKKAVKPALTLRPDVREVKANASIKVSVGMKGLDKVELALEPRGAFSLDLKSLSKTGIVRLKGHKDGKATLIATGKVGRKSMVEKMLHVACVGPSLKILGFGYTPKA